MIIGSIYLGKQVKKKYRAYQAEKAAQRLAEAVKVEDPSSELMLKAPPASPTSSELSFSSTPDVNSPNSVFSPTNQTRSSRSASDLHSPVSQYSTASQPRSEFERKQIQQIFQQPSNECKHQPFEQPPDYRSAVTSPDPTSEPSSTWSTTSAYPLWPSFHGPHEHCPACFAMMQHHQHHGQHFHYLPTSIPHHGLVSHPNATYPIPEQTSVSEIPEMPAESVHGSGVRPQAVPVLVEAPDTQVYQMESLDYQSKLFPLVELPANVPEIRSSSAFDVDDKKRMEDCESQSGPHTLNITASS